MSLTLTCAGIVRHICCLFCSLPETIGGKEERNLLISPLMESSSVFSPGWFSMTKIKQPCKITTAGTAHTKWFTLEFNDIHRDHETYSAEKPKAAACWQWNKLLVKFLPGYCLFEFRLILSLSAWCFFCLIYCKAKAQDEISIFFTRFPVPSLEEKCVKQNWNRGANLKEGSSTVAILSLLQR